MDQDVKEQLERLTEAGRHAYREGFAAGSGGNISIRLRDIVYISPSGTCLGNIRPEHMIPVDLCGRGPKGPRPSKEMGMHLECYRRRTDIGCLFHLHSPYSIAVSSRRQMNHEAAMPAYTPGYAMRVGAIPAIPYYRPGSRELAEAVAEVIGRRNSLLLANHGMVAVGPDPETVLGLAEEIEENAHLTIILGDQGVPLDQRQTEELGRPGGKL